MRITSRTWLSCTWLPWSRSRSPHPARISDINHEACSRQPRSTDIAHESSSDTTPESFSDVRESEVRALIRAVAADIDGHRREIVTEMINRITSELDEVATDPRIMPLLTQAAEGSVAANARILVDAREVAPSPASAAALGYARVLAQRGLPVAVLERGYLLDHNIFLRWCVERLGALGTDPAVVAAATLIIMSRVSERTDSSHQHMLSEYETEREAWLRNRNTTRSARISDLLNCRDVEVEAAESSLGYRLRQHHLGVIVWTDTSPGSADNLAHLERVVSVVAKHLECRERPLFEPSDERTAWVWLPLGDNKHPDLSGVAATIRRFEPAATLAVGAPQAGISGFVRTHQQAAKASTVAQASRVPGSRVVPFDEVGAVALMCTDLDATGDWVTDVLGPLAADDSTARSYRHTLRAFYATGGSYSAAANALTLHRNSVIYRIHRIEQLLERNVRTHRLELEMALALCHWLGPAVLKASHTPTE
ncbi:PucR family transcriptional regulator [Rhodococcus olei]|uniref:PucR family transcriptional regulator n=1 Tax=Rhodococcus olei TaxID=2161675 RepID=UPI0031E72F73